MNGTSLAVSHECVGQPKEGRARAEFDSSNSRRLLPAIIGSACVVVSLGCAASALAAATASVRYAPQGAPFTNVPGSGSTWIQNASTSPSSPGVFGEGSASAGNGSLSTFAVTSVSGFPSGAWDNLIMIANASLTDGFTISHEAAEPVTLTFLYDASGSATTTRNSSVDRFGSTTAEVRWSLSIDSNTQGSIVSASSRMYDSWTLTSVPTLHMIHLVEQEGLPTGDILLAFGVPSGAQGTSYSISMSAQSYAGSFQGGTQNDFISALADFGTSLHWRGLLSATLPDGSPYTGPIYSSSDSGFNYTRPAVPEPGGATLVLSAGVPLVWGGRFRRCGGR